MSGLLNGAAASQWLSYEACRERRIQCAYLPDATIGQITADCEAVAPGSFVSAYWPRTLISDNGDGATVQRAVRWGFWDQAAGASSRYAFTGVTRDQYGSAVGACAVTLYRSSDDALLDSQVSDPSGNFLLSTAYYPDAHYIVAHKTGSPDIDGVTPNTLIGA